MNEDNSNKNKTLAVSTMNVVKTIERNDDSRISALYFNKDRAAAFGGLCKKMAANHLFYKMCEDEELEKLAQTPHHGGVVAIIDKPSPKKIDEDTIDKIIAAGESIIALDGVSNPLNFGAIVRSAAFFGISHIVITGEYPLINGASFRASEGTLDQTNIYAVNNIKRFLQYCATKLPVIASVAHSGNKNIPLTSLGKKNAVLVLGNEELGLKSDIFKICTSAVTITRKNNEVDSLNVAQAAAILCYFLGGRSV